tara:strand:- start:144 stop:545 length:402 start_codon:yes stop_codon:yes gene_type:complete
MYQLNEAKFKVGNSKFYNVEDFENFPEILFKLLKQFNEVQVLTNKQKFFWNCWQTQKPHQDNILWWHTKKYDLDNSKTYNAQEEGEVVVNVYDLIEDTFESIFTQEEKVKYITINPNNKYRKHFLQCLKERKN